MALCTQYAHDNPRCIYTHTLCTQTHTPYTHTHRTHTHTHTHTHQQQVPVVGYYAKQNVHRVVNADQPMDKVFSSLLNATK
jgi:adenylate kinase family enzyme